jgi:hypothetical protein
MGEGNSIIKIDLSGISQPATTLIEKVSDAIGGLFKPFQIRRVAEAEADAEKITAISQIKITELQYRAMSRLVAEEAKKQHNIESITLKALPDVEPNANPRGMNDDWIANFFDKCRLISDEEMQSLWARILAGEANSPGKFSKRTVNVVGGLDKSEAVLFTNLCGFVVTIGDPTPLIFDVNGGIYRDASLNLDTLSLLETAGLIHMTGGGSDYVRTMPQKSLVYYFGRPFSIEFTTPQREAGKYQLHIGQVMFSPAGRQLKSLSNAQARGGFVEYVMAYWKKYGINMVEHTK